MGKRRPHENRQKRDKKLVMLVNGPDQVTLALDEGCDTVVQGFGMGKEIKLFMKAGYPLEEAIRSASEVGARFFGMEQIGALQIGRSATFLVTRGTPHQLPRKLAYLENIYLNGFPSRAYHKNPVKVVHYRPIQQDGKAGVLGVPFLWAF